MKTQSKGLAVVTGASSGIGAVYADRDGRPATCGIVFTEDVVKIARQQGRYAICHGLASFRLCVISASVS